MTSNPTLILANLFATYISAKAMQPPNPPPKNHHKNDNIFLATRALNPKLGSLIFVTLSLSQTLLIAKEITPTSPASPICPNPRHLNTQYLKWTAYSKTCLAIIVISGLARLAAYHALGTDFTFELAKPSRLKTTGIYKYVQHPSYLPLIVILSTNFAFFAMPDGVFGCWLPSKIVESMIKWKWVGLGAWIAAWIGIIAVRVSDEEDMLEKTFGEEWRSWHARTKRFIPWVF